MWKDTSTNEREQIKDEWGMFICVVQVDQVIGH